ncbi:DUF4238 domain-containing protein [Aequorivita sublithincola]|nr:DUF4238 domain-containing protein [Aequorivita sublithincola]
MKKEPEFQGQHKIPQVYLKEFGYSIDNECWLSILKYGSKNTEEVKIIDFTKEINIFDLPFKDMEARRHYENLFNTVENRYKTIINNIRNQKQLIELDSDFLNHFVANILCRTNPTRFFIFESLKDETIRKKFINEITLFSDDTEHTEKILKIFKVDYQLNVALGTVMNHFVHVLRNFNKIIITENNGNEWLTTDSPVHIDKQGRNEWLIPVEAEIYLPLSKDFCLFLYHPKSEISTNPLRKLKENKVNKVDFKTYEKISNKIIFDIDEYLILSEKLSNEYNMIKKA